MQMVVDILRPFVRLFCRLLFRIEFRGLENIPASGPVIVTPNHVSYADPIWITIPLRRPVHYMAWSRLFDIPVLGRVMSAFGAFPVRQETADLNAQREAINLIREGRILVMFPEGGRSKTGATDTFRQGAFRLALNHGVPVMPVTIDGAYEIWPVGRLIPRPGKLILTYHPVIDVEKLPEGTGTSVVKERARDLAGEVQEIVAGALSRELPRADRRNDSRPARQHS